MTAKIFTRPSAKAQRSAWLRSADVGITAISTIKASMESTQIVLQHQGVAIETLQAILEDFTTIGKLMNDGETEQASELMQNILRRISDIVNVYESLGKEIQTSQNIVTKAALLLGNWLADTIPPSQV